MRTETHPFPELELSAVLFLKITGYPLDFRQSVVKCGLLFAILRRGPAVTKRIFKNGAICTVYLQFCKVHYSVSCHFVTNEHKDENKVSKDKPSVTKWRLHTICILKAWA